ncbi:Ribosome maturation factor RimM [Desulfovibrionales bacterium]
MLSFFSVQGSQCPPLSFIPFGRIAKPHGIHGELCVDVLSNALWCVSPRPSKLPDNLRTLFLAPAAGRNIAEPRRILACRPHQGRLLLTLADVPDRTAAKILCGRQLLINITDLMPLAENELYLHELPGLTICLPNNILLGTLTEIQTPTPDQEIWVITTYAGVEILFPATEATVVKVDIPNRTAIIDPPPGLLEIYTS